MLSVFKGQLDFCDKLIILILSISSFYIFIEHTNTPQLAITMIVFDLACLCGYQFEGWFQDHDDYLAQQGAGLLSCPECGGNTIRKIMSAVAVRTGDVDGHASTHAGSDSFAESAAAVLHKLQEYVEKSFEDVGSELPEKALKIHYGIEEARNIRGVATPQEEKMLKEEGIELLKIPMFKKEEKKAN